jgi:hypothetical protein
METSIVCFFIKEPRPVDLGNLMISIGYTHQRVIFNVLEITQTRV